MIKKITKSALIIVDQPILLPNILKYLFKFNFKKIVLLKKINSNLDLKLSQDFRFKFIIRNYKNKKFSYNDIKKKTILNNLEESFLVLKTSKFIDVNLFELFRLFNKYQNKLIITIPQKKRIFNNSEYFFLRKKLINSYDFSFREIFKRKNYQINFVNDEFLYIKKKISKKKLLIFFLKLIREQLY